MCRDAQVVQGFDVGHEGVNSHAKALRPNMPEDSATQVVPHEVIQGGLSALGGIGRACLR